MTGRDFVLILALVTAFDFPTEWFTESSKLEKRSRVDWKK